MASHQDMDESDKVDDLPDDSHKNGTKKKHVQLQIMENNNSEDWHGTRLSLLNRIHVDYRNIERTLNEGPSFSAAPHQTLANHTIENEYERRNSDGSFDCLDRVNGVVSNYDPRHIRHLNGTGFLLMNPNNTDRLNHQLHINGTRSCTDTSTSTHTECYEEVNSETLGDNSDLPAVDETDIRNGTTSPNVLHCQIDANQFDNQQESVKTLHSNVVSQHDINTLEHSVENHREVFQNGHDCAEETLDYRISDLLQNNLDPSDVVSQENHGCCGFSCNNVEESVLNVVSCEMPKESTENQSKQMERNGIEVELNNFLLENFPEQVNNVDCDEEVGRQEKPEDVDSDLDAGNQGQSSSSSSSSSSSDIVDDMIMNVELGNRLQLSSSAAMPTCLPGENLSEDSDEGLEVDVCDDVSEREEESNNERVENIPMDDGDDDGCLDVWDMPQIASSEEPQEGQVNNNADTVFDFLPENYTLNERDNLCRNSNDTDLRELDRYHGMGDISNYPENKDEYEAHTHQTMSNGLAMNTNSLDMSLPQDFSHISCNGGSMNYFQGAAPQSSQKQSMSEAEKVHIFEQTKTYKTDDEDSIGDSSNVSDTEFGFNHQCENLNNKIGEYKDTKTNAKTEIFSSVFHGNERELSGTDNHSQVSNTFGLSVSSSSRDQLPDNFRNCRHFEDALMSVNNESRSASSNQRQLFSIATGGSLHSPSNFPHCSQSKEQEDERHSEKRLLLQEVKDQMALQLRRLDDRQHEELRFEEVLQAEFGVEEQDDLDLDEEDDDLRPSNYIGVYPIQDDAIGSEEESSDIIESVACLSVDDVGLPEIDGACGCSNESSHETLAMANEEAHCGNRNCRTWHNLINEDENVIGNDGFGFASINDDQQRGLHSRENDQQPFIIWRQSLLRGENEPNEYDSLSELEGYVIDRNKEFVVRRKHQMNPPNDNVERRCLTETGEFNHNQNNNEEDIDSPESLVELEENILRDRLLALKPDDVDPRLWSGLHPSNVLGNSEEISDTSQLDTASGSIASNVITSFPAEVTEHVSEAVTDDNSCNNSKLVGTDDNKQNRNIIQVCKQRSKTVEQLPPNSAFIWTPRKAQSRPEYHKGTHQFLHLAVKNALIALGYNPNLTEERGLAQHIKESCSTVSKLLVSSRKHYGLPEDIKAALSKHSSNEVFCRFFSFYPPRKVDLYKWLKEWISLGVVPLASFNPQVGVAPDSTVPKEWRHQMIYGVDEEQAYLCTPNVRLGYQNLMNQLSSDSILLVAREDVVNRWDRWSRLGELKHPPDNDARWIQMNVLGQVVNMMREQSAPKPHEDYSRRYYYKPLKQRRTTHIRIPACYRGGITLCAKIKDKKACDAIQNAPELPLLE